MVVVGVACSGSGSHSHLSSPPPAIPQNIWVPYLTVPTSLVFVTPLPLL